MNRPKETRLSPRLVCLVSGRFWAGSMMIRGLKPRLAPLSFSNIMRKPNALRYQSTPVLGGGLCSAMGRKRI